jgi:hypothetical protein
LYQAILFGLFAVVFLFTSAKMKVKKRVLWLFGLAVLVHATCLTAKAHYPVFGNVLWVSGTLMFGLMAYMCYMIYVDLARRRRWGRKPIGDGR